MLQRIKLSPIFTKMFSCPKASNSGIHSLSEVVALRRKFFLARYPADAIAKIQAFHDPAAMIEIEAIAAGRSREGI